MNPILGATPAGDPMSLDVERLIGSHACIVANSGGGKSGLIRRLLEVTHGRIQHIVLDVEDEFYTLREHFDYVIAGGDGADAPATIDNASALARMTLEQGFSLIVQLNDLGPDGAPQFVGRFLEALIAAPRALWRPLLVILDEAQRFAPQEGATEATHGVRALAAQGRKRGFTAILASQRIAKIDPDVRGDINNWMLGRVGQSLDRRTMADALGFPPNGAEARGLQGLADRTFWGFGPALTREPTLFRVSDVETTPVRPGQAKVPTPPPPEALRAILQGLAVAEVPADQQAPSEAAAARPAPSWPDQREEVARLKAHVTAHEATIAALNNALATERRRISRIAAICEEESEIPAASGGAPASPPSRERATPPKALPHTPAGKAKGGVATTKTGLNAAAEALAGLLKGLPGQEAAWPSLLIMGGFRPGSGWIRKSQNQLVEEAYIEGSHEVTRATERLIESDILALTPRTPAELRALWRAKLRGPGGAIATWLAENGPSTRQEIADGVGMSSGAGWFRKGIKDVLGSNLAREEGGKLIAHPLLVDDHERQPQ